MNKPGHDFWNILNFSDVQLGLRYSQTSIYVLNWSQIVVLIAKSNSIEIGIPVDLHVKWVIWSMTFAKELQKFVKPLDLHVKFLIST
jgi:hypothetical protein